jgi:hypothetical protein
VDTYYRKHRPGRPFAAGRDAGLINCTWPRSPYLDRGVRYRNEVWTGVEYQVAGGMIWEGLVEEGLAICRGIHDRYHPARHNPFNEVECGDHYARSLASWGVYNALLGFEYSGPGRRIGFAPRLSPENFAAAFTSAGGWGLFRQNRSREYQKNLIEIRWGRLPIKTLVLEVPEGAAANGIEAAVNGRPVPVGAKLRGSRLVLEFSSITLTEGQSLQISIGM